MHQIYYIFSLSNAHLDGATKRYFEKALFTFGRIYLFLCILFQDLAALSLEDLQKKIATIVEENQQLRSKNNNFFLYIVV